MFLAIIFLVGPIRASPLSEFEGSGYQHSHHSSQLKPQGKTHEYQSHDDFYPPVHPKYDFSWVVKDEYSGNDYGHQETRDGYETKGSYYVLLPDGRKQHVKYYVSGKSGFVAEVTYEGKAIYPQVQHHGYHSHNQGYQNQGHKQSNIGFQQLNQVHKVHHQGHNPINQNFRQLPQGYQEHQQSHQPLNQNFKSLEHGFQANQHSSYQSPHHFPVHGNQLHPQVYKASLKIHKPNIEEFKPLRPLQNIKNKGFPMNPEVQFVQTLQENVHTNVHENVHANVHENVHANVHENLHANVQENLQQKQQLHNINSGQGGYQSGYEF